MVDFALAAEREDGLKPENSISASSPSPPVSTDHDDDDGSSCWGLSCWRSASGRDGNSPSAGHCGRRRLAGFPVLTLYTMPVIYLFFARLERRFSSRRRMGEASGMEASSARAPSSAGASLNAGRGSDFAEHHPSPGCDGVVDAQRRVAWNRRLPQPPDCVPAQY